MSSKEGKVAVDLTTGIVGRWKETYQWIPIFGAFATIAMAFSAGANNLAVPNENHNFNGGGLLWKSLEWTVAPLISCLCSYIFFKLLRAFLLRSEDAEKSILISLHIDYIFFKLLRAFLRRSEDAEKSILIFLPIGYGISSGILCLFVNFQINGNNKSVNAWLTIVAVLVATLVGAILSFVVKVSLTIKKSNDIPYCKSSKQSRSIDQQCIEIQDKTSSIEDDEKC